MDTTQQSSLTFGRGLTSMVPFTLEGVRNWRSKFAMDFPGFPVTIDGWTFPSAAAAYEYGKFRDGSQLNFVAREGRLRVGASMGAPWGDRPALRGGEASNPLTDKERIQWHLRRERRMLTVLRAKFTQHESLGAALMATYPSRLLSHATGKEHDILRASPPGSGFWYVRACGVLMFQPRRCFTPLCGVVTAQACRFFWCKPSR